MRALTLEETHGALLEILVKFDEICKEHGLPYSLAFGTLLGAVRHKGFIPWDDDVDVVMPRPDYERFYDMVQSGEIDLGDRFVLSADRGKKAFYPFLKLMDKTRPIKRWSQKEVPYLYIDIFPLDGAPQEEKKLKKLRKKSFKYSAIMALARWAVPEHRWMLIFRVLGFPFYLGATLYGMSRAARKAAELAQKTKYEESENCAVFCFDPDRWLLPREAFTQYTELPFDGYNFQAVAAWDEWLTLCYGDYMTPPPQNKQFKHNLKVLCQDGEEAQN